jgi:hypothetical protein
MFSIPFDQYDFSFKKTNDQTLIKDIVRKKWVVFTPEEWVRQNMIWYLHQSKKISLQQIAVEKKIRVGERDKRFDIVVYDGDIFPFMLIECKNQTEPISENALTQLLNYQSVLQAKFIVLTNGTTTYCWDVVNREYLTDLPDQQ